MKKVTLGVFVLLLFFVTGCRGEEAKLVRITDDFSGYITEKTEMRFLVEFRNNQFISFSGPQEIIQGLSIGDYVIVEVDGGIAESNPPQAAFKNVWVVEMGIYNKGERVLPD